MVGEQITWQHSWPLAPWASALLVFLLVALIYWSYRAERPYLRRRQWFVLLALRTLAMLGVFFAAWGWKRVRFQTDRPKLLVILDVSDSMNEPDGTAGMRRPEAWRRSVGWRDRSNEITRIDVAHRLLTAQQRWLRRAARRYELRFFTAAERLVERGVPLEALPEQVPRWKADGQASHLARAIEEAVERVRGLPTAGIVFLTDGAVTGGPPLDEGADAARRAGIPVFFVGLGRKEADRDLRIESVAVDSPVFLGDQVRIDVTVRRSGALGGRVEVELLETGSAEVVAKQSIDLDALRGPVTTVGLWYEADRVGRHELLARVQAHRHERNVDNNEHAFSIDVQDATVRVLLVSALPSWEYRFLKQLLERTRTPHGTSLELTTVLQDADPEYAKQDASARAVVPVDRTTLFRFDVIVLLDADLGRLSRSTLEHIRTLVEEHGAGIVLAAGPHFFPESYRGTPLEDFLPAEIDAFDVPSRDDPLVGGRSVRPTRLGRRHPVLRLRPDDAENDKLWRSLPRLRWFVTFESLKSDTWPLLETEPSAGETARGVVFWRYLGTGSVVFHATDETFLWARYRGSDRYYAQYWMQLVRELGRRRLAGQGGAAELVTDRRVYQNGEATHVRLRLLPSEPIPEGGPLLRWESDNGRTGTLQLARRPDNPEWFEGVLAPLPPGRYHLELVRPATDRPVQTDFQVEPAFGEAAHRQRDESALQAAARAADGRVLEADQVDRLVQQLPKVRPSRVAALPPEPVWNRWPWLLLLAALLGIEWSLRRLWSLP